MPKKFKGENTKAVEARARKSATADEKKRVEKEETEDAAWEDNDKGANKKAQRKKEEEDKRKGALERKRLAAELLAEEEAGLEVKAKTPQKKVTQAELSRMREEEKEKANSAKEEKEEPIPENLNRVMTDVEVAESVEEAIEALSVAQAEEEVDQHPEKRMKAAWTAFEQGRISQLRAENPSLRLSQIRQMLRKEWQKSPLNPMNK